MPDRCGATITGPHAPVFRCQLEDGHGGDHQGGGLIGGWSQRCQCGGVRSGRELHTVDCPVLLANRPDLRGRAGRGVFR